MATVFAWTVATAILGSALPGRGGPLCLGAATSAGPCARPATATLRPPAATTIQVTATMAGATLATALSFVMSRLLRTRRLSVREAEGIADRPSTSAEAARAVADAKSGGRAAAESSARAATRRAADG